MADKDQVGELPATSHASARADMSQNVRRFRHRTEFSREKDVFRHLHCWAETYKVTTLKQNAFASPPSTVQQSQCPDTAIAAFAELCALRLHAQRCLVSLISSSTEYILADMTRTMALQHDTSDDDEGEQVWLGACGFPKAEGLNCAALTAWSTARRVRDVPEESDFYYTEGISPHFYIINDARQRRNDESRPEFLKRAPWLRFFTSVPLRGAQGSVIGAVMILDDCPRYGISCKEMAFLEDVSDTIVQHLDATVVRAQHARGERMIQGLGLFNKGQESLRDWWLAQDDARMLSTGRHASKGSDQQRQARLDVEFGIQDGLPMRLDTSNPAGEATVSNTATHSLSRADQQSATQESNKNAELVEPSFMRPRLRSHLTSSQMGITLGRDFDLAKASVKTYERASNLLRETLSAEGAIFVDADTVPSRYGVDGSQDSARSASTDRHASSTKPRSDAEGSESGTETTKMSKVLGFSTRTQSSRSGFELDSSQFQLSQSQTLQLLKLFPRGLVFHSDESGNSYTSSDDGSSQSSTNEDNAPRKLNNRIAQILAKAIKGARTIAFFPIWDEVNDRWRSCALVWSTDPMRFFDQQESLTYLTAFGHSLVAELSRLQSIAADHAKATFISSISHELRSPLHGIMAGVEFLQESQLSPFQKEMTSTIEMAGRTLLDTVDHILDYGKLSTLPPASGSKREREAPQGQRRQKSASKAGHTDKGPDYHVDLARLTEEVVETTINARRFENGAHSSVDAWLGTSTKAPPGLTRHRSLDSSSRFLPERVSVALDITRLSNWVIEIHPGRWTRLITNLLGNALKFTPTGQIKVSLTAELSDKPGDEDSPDSYSVELRVKDTGVGISEDFQKHSLFVPFNQENTHAFGTGLGLSIVKQISKEIKAKLKLSSVQGSGTTVSVRFTPTFVQRDPTPQDGPAKDTELPKFNPIHIQLLQPTTQSDTDDEKSISSLDLATQNFIDVAKKWLQCEVSSGADIPETSQGSPVCALPEDLMLRLQAENPKLIIELLQQAVTRHTRLAVLSCSVSSLSLDRSLTEIASFPLTYISQPFGPRKLVRLLSAAPQADEARAGQSALSIRESETAQRSPDTLKAKSSTSPSSSRAKPSSEEEPRTTSDGGPDSSGHAEDENSIPSPEKDPRPILIVEDNNVNMKLLVALMKKLSMPYECASHGAEAVDIFTRRQFPSSSSSPTPDPFLLILMDLSMPVMDGFTATSRIREMENENTVGKTTDGQHDEPRKRMPIIALTGVTDAQSRSRAFACGIDEYHVKPVKMKDLRELIRRVRENGLGEGGEGRE